MSLCIYGKLPHSGRLNRIRQSPQYRDGSFQNISRTPAMAEDASFFKTMREFMNKPAQVKPGAPLPFIKSDLHNLTHTPTSITWFGHSSYLLKTAGKTILVDPVLSGNAAPLSFMIKAFDGADYYKPAHMPAIDVLLLTHDHYDHLDYKTILQLKPKVSEVLCSLGVGSHLEHWGIEPEKITELDWWQTYENNGLKFTATPARHFSGRGLKRGQTLWSSFVLQTAGQHYFLGGDSGYDSHFKEIGARFGSFALAILECGQYNKAWPHIHMMPEQSAQAAIDLGAEVLMPVHWAKFALAMHPWNESIKRLVKKAEELNVKLATPIIGETFDPHTRLPSTQWWNI